MTRAFGRRDLLRAAGLTLFVPVFLQRAFAKEQGSPPRLVILMQACGTHQSTFWPDASSGTSPILEPILSDAALASKTLLVKGITNLTTGFGNEHDRGFSGLWTGVNPVGEPEDSFAGGPSIDQILKRALAPAVPFPTLNCGVLAADVGAKNGHRRSFSYLAASQQIPTQTNPYRLYAALFPSNGSEGSVAARTERLRLRKSVLDAAAKDLHELSERLGPEERRKLDHHATALREYELRLSSSLNPNEGCSRPSAPTAGLDIENEENVPALADLMIDTVASALACNLTRIVTFQLGLCGNYWRYRWLGINKDSHEEIAHWDAPDGSNAAATEAMTSISRWTAERVARLARALDGFRDADGSVLDDSLVIWANENGDGLHSLANIPVVFLGRAGGRIRRSGVVDAGSQTHYQLGTSVLNLMGVAAPGFGDQPACGPLLGI